MAKCALVIGGGIEGVQAALDIADSGIEVSLIEQSSCLRVEDEDGAFLLQPKLLATASHPNIRIFTDTDVLQIEGDRGSFKVKALQNAQYVDADSCVSCGRCEAACPVNLLSQFSGFGPRAIHRPAAGLKSVPSAYVIDKEGLPPCRAACPAGVNVQGYVALISKGLFKEALDLIKEAVPFPHILGRVCTHPCEDACTRGKIDQPIAIASLKRFVADSEPTHYMLTPAEIAALSNPARVAIIGSGPAGLTCARDLLRLGHKSTVFEALPVAGGMMAVGMPRFRLPREIREAEVNVLVNSGIEIRTSTRVGEDLSIDDLKEQGYEAIFVAIGSHKNLRLGMPGEDLEGVIDSLPFLRAINLKQPVRLGYNVVVIGGGYTGIDVARAAIRMHCDKVRILERYTQQDVSATQAEILETTEEGVEIEFLASPIRIVGENGKVVGVEYQRLRKGEPDSNGRPTVTPIKGSKTFVEADTVVMAIGQVPELSFLGGLEVTNGQTVAVDLVTLSTNMPGIFSGGDAVTGPRSVVEAVAAGRRAAVSIDRFLRGEDMTIGRTAEKPRAMEVDLDKVNVHPGDRRRIPCTPIADRIGNFEEVETGYTNWMALREAKRCLNCGGCSGCLECVRACELGAVHHDMQPHEIDLEVGAIVVAINPKEIAGSGLSQESKQKGIHVIHARLGVRASSRSSLTNASAVASRVITDLSEYPSLIETQKPRVILEETKQVGEPDSVEEPRIGVFVCRCGGSISDVIEVPKLVGHFRKHKDVAFAQAVSYACSDTGVDEIRKASQRYGITLTHAVVAACSCCAIDQICFSCSDRRVECKSKLLGRSWADGLCYEFVNIREHCAWVHSNEPQKAMDKAKALIGAGISRVKEDQLQESKSLKVRRAALVAGEGLGGLQAAADLARQGIPVTLVMNGRHRGEEVSKRVKQRLVKELKQQHGVNVLQRAKLADVEGAIGEYKVTVQHQGKSFGFNVGAIILDLTAVVDTKDDKKLSGGDSKRDDNSAHLPPLLENALWNGKESGSTEHCGLDQMQSRIPGIFICGVDLVETDIEGALIQGSAAASKVSAMLNNGEIQTVQTIAIVNPEICRGCGTCSMICEFGAASLIEQSQGVFVSNIDEGLCRGCGTCVANCPSGALSQNGLSDCQINASLEAMLIS